MCVTQDLRTEVVVCRTWQVANASECCSVVEPWRTPSSLAVVTICNYSSRTWNCFVRVLSSRHHLRRKDDDTGGGIELDVGPASCCWMPTTHCSEWHFNCKWNWWSPDGKRRSKCSGSAGSAERTGALIASPQSPIVRVCSWQGTAIIVHVDRWWW